MAGCKIVTRKLVPFHGRDEEFTNVYYFGNGNIGLSPSEGEATALLDAVIAAEKPVFGNVVRFLGAAAYKIGVADTPGDTSAISVVELPATGHMGTATSDSSMYRECACDVRWLLGGRRYLRSLLHTTTPHGLVMTGATTTAVASIAAPLKTYAEKMLGDSWPGSYRRIAPNGDIPTAIQYNTFLEHRQFHRYRKRNNGLLGQVEWLVDTGWGLYINTGINGISLYLLNNALKALKAIRVQAEEVRRQFVADQSDRRL